MKTVMVTGAAGFIGGRVAEMLLEQGFDVIGVDNLNNYYDVMLKHWRLERLKQYDNFSFFQADIENYEAMRIIFHLHRPGAVINEAARAGVRYSMENPYIYLSTNTGGNLNLLELCREYEVSKFVLASTSSLYAGQEMPFGEDLPVNTPISPYAASKKSAEQLAYTYHYLYGIDVTVLRYFTVYGPAGRPDMSYFRFIKWIMEGKALEIYGDGNQSRDFTYIDDIASGTIKALKPLGFAVINLGNNNPIKLSDVVQLIEKYTGQKAVINYRQPHRADMPDTRANIGKAYDVLGWEPLMSFKEGIFKTVCWAGENYKLVQHIRI